MKIHLVLFMFEWRKNINNSLYKHHLESTFFIKFSLCKKKNVEIYFLKFPSQNIIYCFEIFRYN